MERTIKTRSSRVALLLALVAAALLIPAAPSSAATVQVSIGDNFFSPRELHIDPGDTVVWTNGGRSVHDVKSDKKGEFRSGDLTRGKKFSHTFEEEGYFYYHCAIHGGPQTGMWGLIVVGDPPPPPPDYDKREVLRVPKDYRTIQRAVDEASPKTKIVVSPGVYREAVEIDKPGLAIVGVDRFRTVLQGDDELDDGFWVHDVRNVTIKNLTIRRYTHAGAFFENARRYGAKQVDAIKNGTFGIAAQDSEGGVVRGSFVWGSGDAGIAITACESCSTLIDHSTARKNFIGYWGSNATGVVVRDSHFRQNGAGIVSSSLEGSLGEPNEGHTLIDNAIGPNNYDTSPAAAFSSQYDIPFGTGIWILGARNNIAVGNTVGGNEMFGIVVSQSDPESPAPWNNRVASNEVSTSGMFDLGWDGYGGNNCFSLNAFSTSGPADIENTYGCDDKPFEGVSFEPVDTEAKLSPADPLREQIEPSAPSRPSCQVGAPGCSL